jgi:hypothetical protein
MVLVGLGFIRRTRNKVRFRVWVRVRVRVIFKARVRVRTVFRFRVKDWLWVRYG